MPYDLVTPGCEAVYTGERSSGSIEKVDVITVLTSDDHGNVIRKWPTWSWTWPGQEDKWDDEINQLNSMQQQLGQLDDDQRQIRAHIASLVPCDSGFPVTVDELLNAIGRGKLQDPSFRNGCWCSGMWWEQQSTQPFHLESMKMIHAVLKGYLAGKSRDHLNKQYPGAAQFIERAFEWLGPLEEFTALQQLMMKRMLLVIDHFAQISDTIPHYQWPSESKQQQNEALVKDFFEEGGRGARLDAEISEMAGLPRIHPRWSSKFLENLEQLENPQEKELYKTSAAIASGVHTLSDCHHGTFRYIESWIHGIGTGTLGIPTRPAGVDRERLGQLLFGYVLGLDKWLLGLPMQFLLMDLAHLDLGFDPKNEILRVYAYLGEEKTPVKEWLAACLWHNLTYCHIGGNPGGLIRHQNLLERAVQVGINLHEWVNSVLGTEKQ